MGETFTHYAKRMAEMASRGRMTLAEAIAENNQLRESYGAEQEDEEESPQAE